MNNNNFDPNKLTDDELDFGEIFNILLLRKWFILSVTMLFALCSVIYSINLPNIYLSKSLLSPTDQNNGVSQAMKSYGGIASIAGIDLSQSSGGKTAQAIEKIKTLSFFENQILPNIFLPDLMAVDSWDSSSNKIIYNKGLYNEETKSWVSKNLIPSSQKSFEIFKRNMYVSENRDTGFVTVAVKHKSPVVAKEFSEIIINELNKFYRLKDKREAEAAMVYLNSQMAQTSLSEVKQVIAALLQQKIQKKTLIEANEFYIFSYIDPPAIMEKKSEPSRAIICIIGTIFGFIFGVMIVLIHFFSNKKH
ncbi:Wzz/FepE/Etk N-terminal domain-containing protein [Gammaproteobacteria bacterium]|nr:Wzz/FepE/Etk N-terminal domain-containing protein [Gammaproteobacteria bacterium]